MFSDNVQSFSLGRVMRFTSVVVVFITNLLLFFIAELNPVVWLFHSLFIHSLVDLDCLLV